MAKTKCKGRFEFKDRALHKNKSFTVISKGIYEYFIHGIQPEDYLKTNTNIFDYCGQTRATGEWSFKELNVMNSEYQEKEIQKTLRYYVSNKGSKIVKYNTITNKQEQVEAGRWLQTVFDRYEEKPFSDYDINMKYYLDKINREIKGLQPELFNKQTELIFES
jgi:hypothetical protein